VPEYTVYYITRIGILLTWFYIVFVCIFFYYYTAFNAPCVGHKDDKLQVQTCTVFTKFIFCIHTISLSQFYFLSKVICFQKH